MMGSSKTGSIVYIELQETLTQAENYKTFI